MASRIFFARLLYIPHPRSRWWLAPHRRVSIVDIAFFQSDHIPQGTRCCTPVSFYSVQHNINDDFHQPKKTKSAQNVGDVSVEKNSYALESPVLGDDHMKVSKDLSVLDREQHKEKEGGVPSISVGKDTARKNELEHRSAVNTEDVKIDLSSTKKPSMKTVAGKVSDKANLESKVEIPQEVIKSSSDNPTDKPLPVNGKIESEALPSRILRYIFWRYTWYLKRLQQSLENEMPSTFHMFRVFSIGLKEFMIDFRDLVKVLVNLSLPGNALRKMSLRELELYYYMPRDMIKVAPLLVISSLPLGQNVALPIGYWFPKQLLCHHFWDLQQRHEFAVFALKKRLFNSRPTFRCMQAVLADQKELPLKDKCQAIFYKLGSGVHPSTAEIISLLPLFRGEPFHMTSLWPRHVNALLRVHGRTAFIRRRQTLLDHAKFMYNMDLALTREGIHSLTQEKLKRHLFIRGLNPTNMSTEAMQAYLKDWLLISSHVDKSTLSLLLHLPILLAYNHPTNVSLIY
ncbi:LETM1 domain-containing protein 1 [Oratosquilla oratoria]|uniref:LETM1 domain-containing protein 1 n=1 Tax=Oratosquilla oratoria TaxID=337810 RepID=UPI003F766359